MTSNLKINKIMQIIIFVYDPPKGQDSITATIPDDTDVKSMLSKIGAEGFTQRMEGGKTIRFYPPSSILKVVVFLP